MGSVKIVSASAGSGKTYTLAYRYVRDVVANPSLYSHILAVTFTNKATDEMKQRILRSLNELAGGGDADGYRVRLRDELAFGDEAITGRAAEVRSKILHDYTHFSVLTIDKFFQRIVRSFLKELGVSVNFNLELAEDTLLGNAADRLLGNMATDERIRSHISAMVSERIDDSKTWNVRREIERLGKQLFTESYKSRGTSPEDGIDPQTAFELLTQSARQAKQEIREAAQTMLDFIYANGLEPDDFPYKKNSVGGYVAKMASGSLKPYNSYVVKALEGQWAGRTSPKRALIESLSGQLTSLLEELIDTYNAEIVTITTESLVRENYAKFMLLGDLRRNVEELSREENILHISEVSDMLHRLVAGNDAPFIFEKAGNHFTHYMIDEFQDTSAMQWNNFVPLLQNSLSQTEGQPVLLVGDVKQSIYRWRGGDWSILAGGAAAKLGRSEVESLQDNYRSRAEVVRFMNAIIGRCVEKDSEIIASTLADAREKGALGEELRAGLSELAATAYSDHYQNVPEGKRGGHVTITLYNNDGEGVHPAIKMVESLQARGYRAGDIAILVRRNSEGKEMARMLLEQKHNNPDSPCRWDVITQEALTIGSSPIVDFVVACLRLSADSGNSLARAAYNRWLGRDFSSRLTVAEEEFFARTGLLPPEEAFEHVVIRYELSKRKDQTAWLQALHQQIISFTAKKIADTPLFLKWWDEKGRGESVSLPAGTDAITIDTVHRSKGLGYKAVIIPYCNWSMTTKPATVVWSQARGDSPAASLGSFPVGYEKKMAASHFSEDYYREYVMSHIDNLNLFYVAVTRAKEELHIMIPQKGAATEKPEGKRKESAKETIDKLITASLSSDGTCVNLLSVSSDTGEILDNLTGEVTENERGTVFSFGAPCEHSHEDAAENCKDGALVETGFSTTDISGKLRLRLSHQRYFEEGAGELSPRDYGIAMHEAFEKATTVDDIRRNITLMEKNGTLTAEQSAELSARLARAMENPLVSEWFGGRWDEVRNERGIIVPAGGGYRPDRTMTSGTRAVVVDYKFGLAERKQYVEQVSEYLSLLKSMGYEAVSGYIWYVNLDKVVVV